MFKWKLKKQYRDESDEQVLAVQNNLNFRPRKTLGFKTPNEIFHATVTVNSKSAYVCCTCWLNARNNK